MPAHSPTRQASADAPLSEGPNARIAGGMLILTALVTAVMVVARLASDTDQESLQESLQAIALHPQWYRIAAMARALSGIMLMTAAWYLLNTWIIHRRHVTPWVPRLLMLSGIFTVISGLSALVLGIVAPEISPLVESSNLVRWLSAKVGFATAGLAILIASRIRGQPGPPLRLVAAGSAVLGLAMQFIWIDSATLAHPIIGAGFFLWLITVGGMLVSGRTERIGAR